MNELPDYKRLNRESWNKKVEIHYDSDFYNNQEFIKGKTSLNDIELSLLGDIKSKSILHLQCHFGQDTISLARMGSVTVLINHPSLSASAQIIFSNASLGTV